MLVIGTVAWERELVATHSPGTINTEYRAPSEIYNFNRRGPTRRETTLESNFVYEAPNLGLAKGRAHQRDLGCVCYGPVVLSSLHRLQ